jgi:hypothetical protein
VISEICGIELFVLACLVLPTRVQMSEERSEGSQLGTHDAAAANADFASQHLANVQLFV